MENKKTGKQVINDMVSGQAIRLSYEKDGAIFEWQLPDRTIELITEAEFVKRGGTITG